VYRVQRSLAVLFVLLFSCGVATTQAQTRLLYESELLRQTLELYEKGKFDEAFAKCRQAIRENPREYRAHVLMGLIYGAQRKFDLASGSFAQAIKLQPEDREVYLLKAQVDYFRNKHAEALAAAKRAVVIDPKYAEAHLMVGALLKAYPERRAEAITALRTAIEINPQLANAYDDLGEIFEQEKKPKEAEAIYRQGMLADPKHMAGRFALGRMLVGLNRLEEARQLWESRTTDEDRIMPSFITVLKRAENMKRAKEAIIANPNDPDALVDMGLAVMDGDHWVIDDRQKRAIVLFRKALDAKPDYPRAQHAIVKAYIELANSDDRENKNLDLELAKLRKLDPKLAAEMDQYRKQYQGGLIAEPLKPQQ
jgi:tetratricopeptide (TPR) repeat protein